MKVKLLQDITGTRSVDGVALAWPPAGDEIELSDAEALPLLSNGSARAVNERDGDVEARVAGAVFGDDEGTKRTVERVTVTRERQSRSKRAHEPVNLGAAAEKQPAEDVNGPRLPEVHAEESARVESVQPSNAYVGESPAEAAKASARTAGAKSTRQ